MSMYSDFLEIVNNDEELSEAEKEKLLSEVEVELQKFEGNEKKAMQSMVQKYLHRKLQMHLLSEMMMLFGIMAGSDFKVKVLLGGIGHKRPSESVSLASGKQHYDQFMKAIKEGVMSGFKEMVDGIDDLGSGGTSGIAPMQHFTTESLKQLGNVFVKVLVACGSQYKTKEDVLNHYMQKEVAEGLLSDFHNELGHMLDNSKQLEGQLIRLEDEIKKAARENGMDEDEIFGIIT